MPVRATKRGADRTPLSGDFDVLVCGASFAGLAVARELRATDARVLVLDRYEIGERQTSACAAPTTWLHNLGLEASILQTFDALVFHTPTISARWPLPWTFSTFDYRQLCEILWDQRGPATEFETAKVSGRTGSTVHTDRGDVSAELIVDALGWRRLLDPARDVTPPEALMSRGLEVHPAGTGTDLEVWIHKGYIEAGYGWSFPAGDEVRVGLGSFEPRHHVKEPTVRLAADLGLPPEGYQGNWIPHAIRPAAADGVFFVGDSAGHCIPLTAEGIRTAFYFGIAAGRELRAVLEGERSREQALVRYAHFSAERAWKFAWMKRWQDTVWRLRPRARDALVRSMTHPRAAAWAFGHYGRIAPPEFALPAPPAAALPREESDQIAAQVESRFRWAPFGPSSSAPDAPAPAPAARIPARRLAVVTCMDARLDPLRALGLQLGDAHVIRNAGGLVNEDVLRSLALSHELAGTTTAVIVVHSDCVAQGCDDDVARAAARDGVERLRAAIPALAVSGVFYDLAAGRVSRL